MGSFDPTTGMNGTPDVHDLRGGPARPHALRSLLAAAAFGAVALAAVWASAADLFWDTNGPTPGSGSATGTWGPDAFWNTDPAGGGDGTFTTDTTADDNLLIAAGTNGTGGTITVSGVQSANSITFRNDVAVTISGGTRINLGSATLGGAGIFVTADSRQSNAIATPITLGTNVTFQTLGGGLSLPSVAGFGDVAIVNSGVGSSVGMNGSGGTVFNTIGSVSYSGTSYARSTIGGPIGVNVTALRQGSDTSNLTLADVISVNPTGLTIGNSGIQSLTFFRDNTDLNVLSGTGAVTFDNDSPYAIPMGIDINGNKGQMTVSNTGALTNSGSGRGGVRLDAQITSNVTSITQASPTSTLYLMQFVNVPGAQPAVQNVNTFAGPVNLDAGILFMGASYSSSGGNQPVITALGVTKALENSGPITFNGGTLMYANPSSTDLSQKFTNTSTAPYSLDTNGQSVSLGSALLANDTKGLRKLGPGTLTLTAASTYTGTTTIGGGTGTLEQVAGGTLTIGNGTTGSLNGTTGTDLVFSGTGTFNVAQAAGGTQGMLALTLAAGDATVQATNPGSGNTVVSFASLAPRAAGATANFVTSGGTNGTSNKIVLGGQAAGFMSPAAYFGGASYAAYDAAGYARALVYGSDTNAPASIAAGTSLGVDDATKNVQISGNISAQRTAAVNTLRIGAANTLTLSVGTLALNGILKAGGSVAASAGTIRGGSGLTTTAPGNELVIRTDGSLDTLTILSPLLANGTNALTKSGPGTLRLAGGSQLTGSLAVNQGTLVLDMPTSRSLPVVAGAGTLAVTGPGTLALTRAATITGGLTISAGTVLLDYSDASVPGIDMLNPANRLTLGGDGTIPVIAGGGTLLIKAKPAGVTSQNLSIPLPALSNPGVVTNTGSHRILVDPNGGAGTNVLMGKLANVIGNADSGNAQRLTSNGSTLLLGKTAGAGAGDVRFLFATDGRNGTGYGGTLGGRVVYTPDGGGDLDFCVTFDNTSTPYSIIPVGTGGYAYAPLTDAGGSGWMRFSAGQPSVSLAGGMASGLKIASPDPGRSLTIASGATWLPSCGIIMTGGNDFLIQGGTLITSSETNSRVHVIHQQGTGTLTIASALSDDFSGSQSTLNPIGSNSLIKAGPGTLVLAGANTYGGPTYINEGTLQAGVAQTATTSGPFGGGGGGASSSGIVFGGGTLQYSAANTFDYSDRFLGSSQSAVGQPYRIDTNGQSVAFQYPLTSASGTLTKLGEGTLTLARFSNTYTGNTTIAGGTLALGASATMALTPSIQITSPTATFDVSARTAAAGLTLASNQELKGVGSVKGTITLGTGSVLSPGMNVGSLSFQNNLTLSATSVLRFDLGSPLSAGSTYDQVIVAGVLALGAGTLNFSNFDFQLTSGFANGTYVLFDAGSLTGTLGSSLTGKIGSGDATISTSGTDVVLTVVNYVPEPSSLVLLAAAAAIPAGAWRSRSRLLGPVIVVPLPEVSS